MSNSFWYLGLVVLSILIIIITFWKKRDAKLLIFYFYLAGLIYLFDFIVLTLFNGYKYIPHLIVTPQLDNVVGAIVSNLFAIPSAALVIAAFNLPFVWMVLLSALFMGIEQLFLHLAIFKNYWWNTGYTGFSLLIYFWISRQTWKTITLLKPSKLMRFMILFFNCISIHGSFTFIFVVLYKVYLFHIGVFPDIYRDHFVASIPYICLISLIIAVIVVLISKWRYRLLLIAMIYGLDWGLVKTDILRFYSYWNVNHFFLTHIVVLIILLFFDRFLLRSSRSKYY